MKINSSAVFVSITSIFYISALSLFAYSYLSGFIYSVEFFNADALYLPGLFKSIFLEGKNFSDWILPPSSYLFPDALLYSIAYVLTKQTFNQILIFSILQSLVLFALIWALLNIFIRRSSSISYAALLCTSIILLGLYSPDPYGLSFISAFHFGSLLSFLVLLVLLLKVLFVTSTKKKHYLLAITFCIATLSALSDRLIIIQLFAPTLLVGLYYYIHSKNKDVLKFGLVLVLSYPLAHLIGKLFLPEMGNIESGFGFGSMLNKLFMISNWASNLPWPIQLSVSLFPLALFVSILFLYQNRINSDQKIEQKRLLAYLFLTSATLMLLISGLSNRDFTSRYLLPYLFLSPVFLLILLPKNKSKLLVIILCSFSCLALLTNADKVKIQTPLHPEFIQCVDALAKKHNVSRGMAQYWDAIPLTIFNSANLTVVPVIDDTSPMKWIFNKSEFAGKFSFAVIDNNATGPNKISIAAIEKQLSKKPFEYQCANKTILIFNMESISLPTHTALSNLRSSALESFIKNPRALLIMAQEEIKRGNYEESSRILSEAISLLKQSGASDETIRYYETATEKFSRTIINQQQGD